MLTELFTLGVENDSADHSEDDQSGLALTASATVEATRAGNNGGQDENTLDQAAARSTARGLEGGQVTSSNSRRSQSPTTQALETQFRTMMSGIVSSVDVACDALRDTAREVLESLSRDLGDTERELVGQLQVQRALSVCRISLRLFCSTLHVSFDICDP